MYSKNVQINEFSEEESKKTWNDYTKFFLGSGKICESWEIIAP